MTHDTQVCFKNIKPHHSRWGKDKEDKGDEGGEDKAEGDKGDGREHQEVGAATCATGLRDPSKRTADTAGLDVGSESKHGSKGADGGAEGAGQYAGPHHHTLF